jgi:hypothetical protein
MGNLSCGGGVAVTVRKYASYGHMKAELLPVKQHFY